MTVFARADNMPEDVDVQLIAANAIHAAFKQIADDLEAAGYPVTGDFTPGEVIAMDEQFEIYVRAMALNNRHIAALQDEVGVAFSKLVE